jgi:hypothetical protein
MRTRVAILLGRDVWIRHAGGWRRSSFDGGGGIASPAVSHLAEALSEGAADRTILVYEPEGMAHQSAETPRASRQVFASLARVRSDHPVVMSERLGWGIEPPEPVQGGTFATLLHSELTPGLAQIRDACERSGSRLAAAWPAYTAAIACAGTGGAPTGARLAVILTPNFAAVATCCGGRRSFRSWVGPMSERDWKAFSAVVGDIEARSSLPASAAVPRRGGIAVIADGEPQRLCPVWPEIIASGRLEAVVGMDALAEGALRIGKGHPANLAEAFPRPLELNKCLVGAAAACLVAALALGALDLRMHARLRSDGMTLAARRVSLETRLDSLARNQREMAALRNEVPENPGALHTGRHGALLALAEGLPDCLTLTALSIGADNSFEIGAIVVGSDFDPDGVRRSLERSGFKPSKPDGWAFDAAAGRLVVRGKYGEPST